MNREDQIDNAARSYEQTIFIDHDPIDVEADFIAGAEWADNNRWVRIEDALPTEVGRYLVWARKENEIGEEQFFCNCYYSERHGFSGNLISFNVTHWQSIEPPKAEK